MRDDIEALMELETESWWPESRTPRERILASIHSDVPASTQLSSITTTQDYGNNRTAKDIAFRTNEPGIVDIPSVATNEATFSLPSSQEKAATASDTTGPNDAGRSGSYATPKYDSNKPYLLTDTLGPGDNVFGES